MGSSSSASNHGWWTSSDGRANYPIQLPIRYELITRTDVGGKGKTVLIGSRTIVFTSEKPLEKK